MMRDGFYTPDHVFEYAEAKWGPFDLDAAASALNTKAPAFFTEQDDALRHSWHDVVWCNPPYKKLLDWVLYAHEQVKAGNARRVVLLLPAHTATRWFHHALDYGKVEFIKGKVKFGGAKGVPFYGSVFVIFERAA